MSQYAAFLRDYKSQSPRSEQHSPRYQGRCQDGTEGARPLPLARQPQRCSGPVLTGAAAPVLREPGPRAQHHQILVSLFTSIISVFLYRVFLREAFIRCTDRLAAKEVFPQTFS